MTEVLPIISMHQPWCFWVAGGWKRIETRTHMRFRSLVGKRIGIHAALKWDDKWKESAGPYMTPNQIYATERFLRVGGALICTAFVDAFGELRDEHSYHAMIDCGSTKRYGLILKDVEKIEAVPMKGRQGIWYASIERPL